MPIRKTKTDRKNLFPCYLMITIAILVFAIMIGGSIGVWYYTKVAIPLNKIAGNQKVLFEQIKKLQVDEVEKEDEVVEEEEEEIEYPITLTNKNINYEDIDREDIKELFKEDANTTVEYSNKEWGIEFNIPFNEKWGDENYKIEPFDQSLPEDDFKCVHFGKFQAGEGGYGREFGICVEESKDAKTVINEFKESAGWAELLSGPDIKYINGIEIVQYQVIGLGNPYHVEIIGNDYNYLIWHGVPPTASINEDERLREIIKSIKFIK